MIDAVTSGVPAPLVGIRRHGRTLKQCASDTLAFFDRPVTSDGPTEAINGRLEHLRGSAPAPETSPTTSQDHSSNPEDSDHRQCLVVGPMHVPAIFGAVDIEDA